MVACAGLVRKGELMSEEAAEGRSEDAAFDRELSPLPAVAPRGEPDRQPAVVVQVPAGLAWREVQASGPIGPWPDGEGQPWTVEAKIASVPSATDPHQLRCLLRLGLKSSVSGGDLVATGVLSRDTDARLLALLGEAKVPVAMKPVVYELPTEEAIRSHLARVLPELRRDLATSSLGPVKRALLRRFVDGLGAFGGPQRLNLNGKD